MIRGHVTLSACLTFMVIASGCCPTPRNAVVVKRDFLKTLHDFPTLDGWDENIFALQYLVEEGDTYAIETGWRVLPTVIKAEVVYKEIDWLALALYDQRDLRGVEALTVSDQAIVIKRYDTLQPLDWHSIRRAYLTEHPELANVVASND